MTYQIFILKNSKEVIPFFTANELSKDELNIIAPFTIRYERHFFKDNCECSHYVSVWAESIRGNLHLPANKDFTLAGTRGGDRTKKLK